MTSTALIVHAATPAGPRRLTPAQPTADGARREALFASSLQRSDVPGAAAVAAAIAAAVQQFGTDGCTGQMAQEFADHPEAAAARMRWVRSLLIGASAAGTSNDTVLCPRDNHMNVISHDALIASAEAVLNPHTVDGRLLADVASALVTEAGAVFSGVCIDTSSGTGFCAEHAAVAAMVTAGEYKIMKIVAVWRDDNGVLHVVPPCGRCREFIRQVDPANLDVEVVLSRSNSARLRDLLPHSEWPAGSGRR